METIETCPESLETTGKESDENTATEDELSVATNRTLSNEHEYKPLDTIDNTVIETAESNEDASINDNNLCIGQMDIGEDNGSHGDNRQSFEEVRFSDTSTTDAKTVVSSTEVHVQNTCSTDLSNTGSHDEQPTSENTCMSINDETDKLQHNSCEEQENVDTQEEQLDVHVTTCASSIGQSISDMSRDEDNTRSISPTSELQTSITSNNDTPSICLLQSQSGSESSFVMIDENSLLVDASKFEESGLFYGSDLQRNRGIVHEDRLPTPPPESADDVLLSENVAREMTGQRSSVTPGNDSETSSNDRQSIDSLIENTSSHKKIVGCVLLYIQTSLLWASLGQTYMYMYCGHHWDRTIVGIIGTDLHVHVNKALKPYIRDRTYCGHHWDRHTCKCPE